MTATSPHNTLDQDHDRSGRADGVHAFASLDAMRAIAALAVVIGHVYQLFLINGQALPWARDGDAGVLVFFVLSGFLIATSVLRGPTFSRRDFGIRRAARILPAYYAAIMMALFLFNATPLMSWSGRWDILAHLLLIHSLFGNIRYSIVGVWWTLSLEWFFYISMMVVGPWFRRRSAGWSLAVGMIVMGPLWRHHARSADREHTIYLVQQFPGVSDLFGIGLLVALAIHTPSIRSLFDSAMMRMALMATAGLWLPLVLWIYHQKHPTYWDHPKMVIAWPTLLAIGIGALIILVTTGRGTLDRLAHRSGLAWYGRISYGVFLIHPFVLATVARAWFPLSGDVPVVPYLAVCLVGITLVAVLLHHAVELPAMAWSRRVTRRSSQ